MAQDRPDDDVTSVFRPGASGPDQNEPVSFSKPSGTPDAAAQQQPGGYDPTSWAQQPSSQPGANPYGQSWDPNAQASQPNPYGQNPYGQQGYDPGNPYGQQQGYDPNQYPQYAQAPAYDPSNPYAQQAPGYGQYPQQQAYGSSYPAAYAPTNGMAIAALILAFVFAPLGIVFGVMARNQIKQSGESGDGMALAGIIIGGVFTAFFVLAIVFFVIAAVAASSAISSGVSGY